MQDSAPLFLSGPFAPWREEGAAFDLEVEGQIPADISGAMYRVGPNPHFRPVDPARYHWFEGDGMVHAIFLRDGRATYRNRYVQTAALKLEMQEGRAMFGSAINGSGQPPVLDGSSLPMKNPANTSVTVFDDRLLVFCEFDIPHELRPDTMDTVGRYDFHGKIAGPVTAHFKIDPDNGDMLFFGAAANVMTWYRADRHGVLLDSHQFDMGVPCVVHDFAVTPNYAIFTVSPQLYAFDQVAVGQPAGRWDPEAVPVSRFAVLNRTTKEVRWFDADSPFQVSHYANAYENNGTIVVDAHRVVGQNGLTRSQLANYGADGDYNSWFTKAVAVTTRWELDLATGALKEQVLTDITGEFPRINDSRATLEHRFGYFVTQRGVGEWMFDGLAKVDTTLGRTELTTLDGLTAPGEPVFVPREGATDEDDGWLLSVWWDPATDRSEVVIQDAQDFTAAPVARIKLNHRIPAGFHCSWVPAPVIEAALGANTA